MKNKEWGKGIQKIRQGKKLTQIELADKTNLSVQLIRKIEQNGHIPKMPALACIGWVLEISFTKILLMLNFDLKAGEIFDLAQGSTRP